MSNCQRRGFTLVLSSQSPKNDRMQRTFISLLYSVAVFLAAFFGSCSQSTSPPPDIPDTTSHNFSWTVELLGATSSILFDVAIINDTLAYGVGQFFLRDSTGQIDPILYNFAEWDGTEWHISRRASNTTLRAILAFSPNDIWVATGGPYHWNGTSWRTYNISGVFYGVVNSLWGEDSSDVYMVGDNGSIAHYNGSVWQKIESGTTLPVQDIWGGLNPKTGQTEVIAVASNFYALPTGKKLLQVQGLTATPLPDSGLSTILTGLWFSPGEKYYVVGDGLYDKGDFTSSTPWSLLNEGLTNYYTEAVRGSAANDVFVVGHFGTVLHYNGSTWHNYQNEIVLPSPVFHSVAIKGDLMIAVGEKGGNAVVLVGRR